MSLSIPCLERRLKFIRRVKEPLRKCCQKESINFNILKQNVHQSPRGGFHDAAPPGLSRPGCSGAAGGGHRSPFEGRTFSWAPRESPTVRQGASPAFQVPWTVFH